MEQEHQFIDYIEQSIIKNWDKDALTDYKGITLQYKDVARKIAKFHIVLESAGIQPGDKIAVCGRNSAHWGVTFLATITYGAVIVPILHEFKADNIHNIVNHSEAKLLFVGDQAWENLNEDAMPLLEGIASLTDFTALVSRNEKLTYAFEHRNAIYGQRYPKNFRPEHICYRKDRPEELAIINYTSGTTGYSKGVMLPYRSIWSNVAYCFEMLPVKAGDHIVSMLPMGHVFGMVYDFLPFMILPLYTTISKIDNSLYEASADLGANAATTFFRVTLPLSFSGIISGITMVFLPSMTNYVVSDMLGNSKITIIGKFIETYFGTDWHMGSMIALILLLVVLVTSVLTGGFKSEESVRGANL